MKQVINLILFVVATIGVTLSSAICAVMVFIPENVTQIQWARPGIIIVITVWSLFGYILMKFPNHRMEKNIVRGFWWWMQVKYPGGFVGEFTDTVIDRYFKQKDKIFE